MICPSNMQDTILHPLVQWQTSSLAREGIWYETSGLEKTSNAGPDVIGATKQVQPEHQGQAYVSATVLRGCDGRDDHDDQDDHASVQARRNASGRRSSPCSGAAPPSPAPASSRRRPAPPLPVPSRSPMKSNALRMAGACAWPAPANRNILGHQRRQKQHQQDPLSKSDAPRGLAWQRTGSMFHEHATHATQHVSACSAPCAAAHAPSCCQTAADPEAGAACRSCAAGAAPQSPGKAGRPQRASAQAA